MPTSTTTAQSETTESLVSCQNSHGLELHATLLKLSRFQITFEVYSPTGTLRLSEVLSDFRILIQGQPTYSGRAVVSNLINLGSVVVCEATLDEACLDLTVACPVNDPATLRDGFEKFMVEWGKNFKVHPEFKGVIADMQTFFMDLRLWLDQLELGVRSQPAGDRLQIEREVLLEVQKPVLPAVAPVLEKFEAVANTVEAELQSAHRTYMKRQIHPLVLC